MEYVCTGAILRCSEGTSTSQLKATPKNVTLTGKDQANIADYVSQKNVPSFGRCRSLAYPPTASATAANHGKLTPMPCVPGTCPKWKVIDKNSIVCGEPALLKPATLKCMFGGTISIVNPGQTKEIKVRGVVPLPEDAENSLFEQEIPEELLQEFNDLETQGLNKESVLDGIQLTLDGLGMVPLLGAVPDLLNASISALRGDWVGAGLSVVAAVPGVGDVVGGAKIAYKGAKIANKAQNIQIAEKVVNIEKGRELKKAKLNNVVQLQKPIVKKVANGEKIVAMSKDDKVVKAVEPIVKIGSYGKQPGNHCLKLVKGETKKTNKSLKERLEEIDSNAVDNKNQSKTCENGNVLNFKA